MAVAETNVGGTWRRRLLALGLGFALVCLLEAALHLIPSLAPPAFAIDIETRKGLPEQRDLNPLYPSRFFSGFAGDQFAARLELLPHPHLAQPSDSSFRILFLGGSTARGYPHPPEATAAAHLQRRLQEAWPHRQVEVFSAGIIAVSSFAVARTLEEAMVLHPDVVVIYSGHNEFYGVYASLRQGGRSVRAKSLHYTLVMSRLAGLARSGINLFRSGADLSRNRSDSLLDLMASAGKIGPDDDRREVALESLRENLTFMVRFCRQRGIPVILCTLVSNDTGFAPDHSYRFVDLEGPQRDRWEDLIARADALLARTELGLTSAEEALHRLSTAGELHDRHAFLHFLKGKALVASGQAAAANGEFILARNRDSTPWRAPEAFNGTIRQVAAKEGAGLAAVNEAFRRQSPEQGIGNSLMNDHLHPSESGQQLLAAVLAESVFSLGGEAPEESSP